ncbi:multicopper oxidase [Colletotrichum orchidophilum]|uniref:Multicopper oxidase n=1 Tax=Colletotrichum orchidophilum TaxID=1209926 RepID=A0A1G4B7H7_9PEZI|nr:multicopper oxidase [Colletotrichum orchidophilum]OHE97232.1 multicopper oxidase [Colletotrichum orchidophilum]
MDVERGRSGHERLLSPALSISTDALSSYSSAAEDTGEKSPFLSSPNDDERPQRLRSQPTGSWLSRVSASLFGVFVFFFIFYASDLLYSAFTSASAPHHLAAPVYVVKEPIPSSPRLRNSSEYVLDSAWDFNAATGTREYYWTINDATLNPDGIFRPMMLINNQFPGPLIQCNEGDTIVVHVRNMAVNATAIHFHGMYQNGTNSMDGTVGVTQCPIAHNATFTYRFTVDNQSGTYWYHAHHSVQASDGLVGPLVIHPRDDHGTKNQYATDRVVLIQDHYHNTSAELLMDYLQPDQENDEPVPSSGLINGRNYRNCADFDGWNCHNENPRLQSLNTLDLAPNERHRLRFINVGAFAEFQVEIDEHPFYITEVDGTGVHPEPFHRLNILPAQRYSVVVETNLTTANTFWMRARMITHCFARENPWLDSEVKAVVRYSTPASSNKETHETSPGHIEPQSKSWNEAVDVDCRDMNTSLLRPLDAIPAPNTTATMYLRANFEIGAWRLSRGFFNASTWHANLTSPALYRFLDAAAKSDDNGTLIPSTTGVNDIVFNPEKEFVYQTHGIQSVNIIISNFDDGAHPFHIHGHKFFVLKQGPSGYPPNDMAELERELAASGVLENPLRRDTMTVQGYGWAVIRVVLDNPGVWAFHCHNAWHAEAGMMMMIAARVETAKEWALASEEKEGEEGEARKLCGLPGVEKGARPSDDLWFGNFG